MSRFGLRSLVYHETVPGPHSQIALDLENEALPRFRRARVFGGNAALTEGWALHAERLAADSGWYEGDLEGLIGQLTLLELREKARQVLGNRFSMAEFHDAVLGAGTVPLDMLERAVDAYIRTAGRP